MKTTTRLSFLLLIAVLFTVTLVSTQGASTTSTSLPGPLFIEAAGRKTEPDILKRYYELSTLSIKETKASFRNASPNDKSKLWRTHLALFLVKQPELNEQQKKIILAAMSLATPEFFERQASDPDWKTKVREPLRSLEKEVAKAFLLRDAAKIFATLRDDEEPSICGATYESSDLLNSMNYKLLSNSGMQWAHSRFGEQNKDKGKGTDQDNDRDKGKGKSTSKDKEKGIGRGGPCECSTESDWCPISSYCNGANCSPTSSGCGTLWAYPCNGASCR